MRSLSSWNPGGGVYDNSAYRNTGKGKGIQKRQRPTEVSTMLSIAGGDSRIEIPTALTQNPKSETMTSTADDAELLKDLRGLGKPQLFDENGTDASFFTVFEDDSLLLRHMDDVVDTSPDKCHRHRAIGELANPRNQHIEKPQIQYTDKIADESIAAQRQISPRTTETKAPEHQWDERSGEDAEKYNQLFDGSPDESKEQKHTDNQRHEPQPVDIRSLDEYRTKFRDEHNEITKTMNDQSIVQHQTELEEKAGNEQQWRRELSMVAQDNDAKHGDVNSRLEAYQEDRPQYYVFDRGSTWKQKVYQLGECMGDLLQLFVRARCGDTEHSMSMKGYISEQNMMTVEDGYNTADDGGPLQIRETSGCEEQHSRSFHETS